MNNAINYCGFVDLFAMQHRSEREPAGIQPQTAELASQIVTASAPAARNAPPSLKPK